MEKFLLDALITPLATNIFNNYDDIFFPPTPPISSLMITEAGDFMVTEGGAFMELG